MKEIKLFNRVLTGSDERFDIVNGIAVEKGLLVHPDCCNMRVLDYMETLPGNHNTTFYKTWSEVLVLSRFEIALDQMRHYASTYGTQHKGEAYIKNAYAAEIDFTDCKVLLPITKEEIQGKIEVLFYSGIALKQDTIEDCIALLDELELTLEVSKIRNKEALMYFCKKSGQLPVAPEEMVRYLIFLALGTTLLIKDRVTVMSMQHSQIDFTKLITQFGIEKLSSVFHRYKPLFLSMKVAGHNTVVNKLRKLANKHHVPLKPGYWQNILSDTTLLPQLADRLKELNNFKKVALLQTILVRQKDTGVMPVRVRNGKLFVKERNFGNKEYYSLVYGMVYTALLESLSSKACKISLPKGLELTLPASEKAFTGNIPFGSYVRTNKDVIVGINWKGADGADDLDLSMFKADGQKIGWDAGYVSNDPSRVIYSGDMTSANPEATELLYCETGIPDGIVQTNLYSGNDNSKYTLFVASAKLQSNKAMVDPNKIVFQTELTMSGRQQMNGIFANKKFIFIDISSGSGHVATGRNHDTLFIEHMSKTSDCFLDLRTVLTDAGFEVVSEGADVSLQDLDKSKIVELIQ